MAGGKFMGPASFNRPTKQFIRVPNPYCYHCPLKLEKARCGLKCLTMLGVTIECCVNGRVAGKILELLQARGGQIVFSREYLQGVRDICSEFGIGMIYDEIQTYARSGVLSSQEAIMGSILTSLCSAKGLEPASLLGQSSSGMGWKDSRRTPRSFKRLPTVQLLNSPT
jgi:4-aminobutyrate aminotransferase-like enzyme